MALILDVNEIKPTSSDSTYMRTLAVHSAQKSYSCNQVLTTQRFRSLIICLENLNFKFCQQYNLNTSVNRLTLLPNYSCIFSLIIELRPAAKMTDRLVKVEKLNNSYRSEDKSMHR